MQAAFCAILVAALLSNTIFPRPEKEEHDGEIQVLNSLANALQNTGEPAPDSASFNSFCTHYLSHDRSPKPELPLKSTPRSLAGKPLAGFRATPSRRIPVLYGMVIYNTCQEPTVTSIIDVKKTTAWGESGFPAEFPA